MGNVKLIVIYPCPKDIESFERVYKNEHVPLAVEKLAGKTKLVASKIVGSPQGTPPFHRIAEIQMTTPSFCEPFKSQQLPDSGRRVLRVDEEWERQTTLLLRSREWADIRVRRAVGQVD